MRVADLGSIPELAYRAAEEFGHSTALEGAGSSSDILTYIQLLEAVRRGASSLRAMNLRPGDRVLLALESRPDWAAAFFAILQAGLVAVPIPADTPCEAAAAVAAHAQTKGAIFSPRTKGLAAALGATIRIPLERLFEADVASEQVSHDARQELALLAFTSGSTQQPRAVELTHGNLLSDLAALLQVRGAAPGDALLSMLPPAHLFELTGGLLAPLACGARVVYAGSLLPNRIVDALCEHKITHALAVPALVECLYEEVLSQLIRAGVVHSDRGGQSPAETIERFRSELDEEDLGRIRAGVRSQIGEKFATLVVGGAAIDTAMAEVVAALGIRVEVGYGLTEASPIVSMGLVGQCPAGSVGRPLPGVETRVDERGEILVRGANVMRGYYQAPQATAAALPDGWLRTGDRGRLDEDGFLFVVGRFKEAMVTAAGETIYPEEMEPYYRSPLFAEFCVAALRGEHGNDSPTLFVVPSSPQLADEELEDAFRERRASTPARLRVERMIRIAGPLPRTASGKVRRRVLVQQFNRREKAR